MYKIATAFSVQPRAGEACKRKNLRKHSIELKVTACKHVTVCVVTKFFMEIVEYTHLAVRRNSGLMKAV